MADARAVDQYVDAAELSNRAPDNFLDLGFFRDIELQWESAPAESVNVGGELVCATRVVIDEYAICAFSGKSQGDGASTRVLRASDQGNFVF